MRNYQIDLLRFVGLMMIILAHCSPPPLVFQIRNFDVPLMVFISGISFRLSYRENITFSNYVLKRIKRLALPVWIFLSFYFLVSKVSGINYTKTDIATSYLFLSGIGYVWIIRVFLMIALVAPILYKIEGQIKSNSRFILILSSTFIIYDIIQSSLHPYFDKILYLQVLDRILFYVVPYSIIFLLGLRLYKLENEAIQRITIMCFLLFAVIAVYYYFSYGDFIQTNEFKYPISIYYLSYALAITLTLWHYSKTIWEKIKVNRVKKFILFVAQNSIWIYLWHIPFINIFGDLKYHYFTTYIIVILLSTCTVYFQKWLLENQIFPFLKNPNLKRELRYILTG